MVKRILFLLFTIVYSLFTYLHADSVEASVNTQEVVKGNPVQLRIKAIGGAVAFPTINHINGINITNSGTSKSSSMRITSSGMKSETQTTRTYIFTPTHDMTIPSYTVNISGVKYKTKPIEIKIVQSQVPAAQNNADFSFVLKADKQSVYEGESFILTLFVSVSNHLRGVQIGDFVDPSSKDFFVKPLEEQKEYQIQGASVIEKRYILTAKKEGNFTIASASAKLGQMDRSTQDIFGRYGMRWTPIVSNTVNISVKALDKDIDMVGDFTLNAKIDKQKIKANKPVNLTITIEGKGNLEDFEFPTYEIDGVTVYGTDAKIESRIEKSMLESTYTKSFAFIGGDDFIIPARKISMYNPYTKEKKTLEVPSYEIEVEGDKSSVTTPTPHNAVKNKASLVPEVITKEVEVRSISWWMLALAFGLGALAMYVLQFIPKLLNKKERSYKESDVLKILYSHISDDKEVEEMVRKLYAKKHGDKSVQIDKKVLRHMVEKYR